MVFHLQYYTFVFAMIQIIQYWTYKCCFRIKKEQHINIKIFPLKGSYETIELFWNSTQKSFEIIYPNEHFQSTLTYLISWFAGFKI